jgi:hypothetical protein
VAALVIYETRLIIPELQRFGQTTAAVLGDNWTHAILDCTGHGSKPYVRAVPLFFYIDIGNVSPRKIEQLGKYRGISAGLFERYKAVRGFHGGD